MKILYCNMNSLPPYHQSGAEITIDEFLETSLDKGTQRKTTENELPSLTQCTA